MKITSKFRMTARLSGTDLALKPLLCSKVLVISRLLKYKLCPPPFVSRVLLSWQLVDPYRNESNSQTTKRTFGQSSEQLFPEIVFSILILQGEIMGSKGNLILKVSKPDDDSPSMSIEIHKIYHDAPTDPPQQYFIFYND